MDESKIKEQMKYTLKTTDLKVGERIKGKVRDIYFTDDRIYLIATDRQSAFDRNLAFVPFKGEILTRVSAWWFEKTKDIIKNHLISMPDPNVVECKKLNVFPVEVVVRGYLTGVTSTAAWTAYSKGEREFCGNTLPEGMVKNQKFDTPIVTPTTKDEHDEKISGDEIVSSGRMTRKQWDYVKRKALELFDRGTELASRNGLILVDTKYEFGYDEKGDIYLIDEIHTPDSSRYWMLDSYQERFEAGDEPEYIDKEFLRLWFRKNCDPYKDKILPDAPEDLVIELAKRYIRLFEMITGEKFDSKVGDVEKRIKKNLVV